MQQLFRLWYIESAPWAWQRYLGILRTFDGTFAIKDTWRNISRPLFQDYTWQGRIIGVFLRLARIGLALFIYLLTALISVAVYLAWLVLPVIFIMSTIGSFIGPSV